MQGGYFCFHNTKQANMYVDMLIMVILKSYSNAYTNDALRKTRSCIKKRRRRGRAAPSVLPSLSPSLSVGVHNNGSVRCNMIMFIIIDTHTYTRSKTQ